MTRAGECLKNPQGNIGVGPTNFTTSTIRTLHQRCSDQLLSEYPKHADLFPASPPPTMYTALLKVVFLLRTVQGTKAHRQDPEQGWDRKGEQKRCINQAHRQGQFVSSSLSPHADPVSTICQSSSSRCCSINHHEAIRCPPHCLPPCRGSCERRRAPCRRAKKHCRVPNQASLEGSHPQPPQKGHHPFFQE